MWRFRKNISINGLVRAFVQSCELDFFRDSFNFHLSVFIHSLKESHHLTFERLQD